MRRPTVRPALQWLVVTVAVLAACGLIMRAAGMNVRLGPPAEFGWTAYPMMAVAHRAEPGNSLSQENLPPKQVRPLKFGTFVTWADGTRTLYIHQ
jgi:hypothetical protein